MLCQQRGAACRAHGARVCVRADDIGAAWPRAVAVRTGAGGVTFADAVGPGPQSLRALGWLARVGASPLAPLRLVLGCGERVAFDHVRRLADAGLVTRVAMRRGDGSLIVITRQGALQAGYEPGRAPRSVAPATWAHICACAWTSAWLELRGRAWVSERDVLEDDWWRFTLTYQDHRGTVRSTHRPDLAVQIKPGIVAIEVELRRKTVRRLWGILRMYDQLIEDEVLAGVIYVTTDPDVEQLVRHVAASSGPDGPGLSFRTMQVVIQQTREAAASCATASSHAPAS